MPRTTKTPVKLTTYQRLMIEAKAEFEQAMKDKKSLRVTKRNPWLGRCRIASLKNAERRANTD